MAKQVADQTSSDLKHADVFEQEADGTLTDTEAAKADADELVPYLPFERGRGAEDEVGRGRLEREVTKDAWLEPDPPPPLMPVAGKPALPPGPPIDR